MVLIAVIAILCMPLNQPLLPVIYAGDFYPVYLGISRLSYALISLLWAASAFLLLTYNYNFLNGVESGHSLSFILSVLISFAICLLYMSRIYRAANG
jgi:small-conductance mechanosensitive channel